MLEIEDETGIAVLVDPVPVPVASPVDDVELLGYRGVLDDPFVGELDVYPGDEDVPVDDELDVTADVLPLLLQRSQNQNISVVPCVTSLLP